jgi:hypothetical protein
MRSKGHRGGDLNQPQYSARIVLMDVCVEVTSVRSPYLPALHRNKIRAVHFMSLHNVIRHGLNWPSRARERVPGKNNLDRTSDSAAEPYFEK